MSWSVSSAIEPRTPFASEVGDGKGRMQQVRCTARFVGMALEVQSQFQTCDEKSQS
jgi:hypothetical protein